MELKKNPKADLRNRRTLFLEIGLVVALGVCIIAFSISQKEKVVEQIDFGGIGDEIEQIDITVEKQPEPEPVRQTVSVIADILNVVKNDTKISTNFDFVDFDDADINVMTVDVADEEIEEDAPFLSAEEMPSFMGGDLSTFRKWVTDRFRYPTIAQENGIQGRVILQFVIERDGSLTNIEVLQTADPILSDEAIRVMKLSPKWSPGKQRNMPVRIKYTLPIEFKITN